MPKKRPDARRNVNLAADFSDDENRWLGDRLVRAFERDSESRLSWYENTQGAYKLASALPTRSEEEKPWPNAANVVVPMLASAVMQFSSRAYAAMFEQGYPERVRALPISIGDIDRARRQEQFLNWQTIVEMEEYEAEWDIALLDWPIFGHIFKKVTWDHELRRPVSVYAPATDIYVPYGSRSRLSKRGRVTHLLPPMLRDDVLDHGKTGFFVRTDEVTQGVGNAATADMRLQRAHDEIFGFSKPSGEDHDEPLDIIETHFFGKIRENDSSPAYYKAWVELSTRTVLRLVSRTVSVGGKEHTIDEFISVPFIPNPRGPYGIGFGTYLGPLNEMANTLFNQFIDAGALANQPFAFYTRGAGLQRRDMRLFPGAFIPVNSLDDIREGKLPGLGQELPILLQFLNEYSRDLSSVSEEMTGGSPKGVREPTVRGTFARLEQGLQAFSVIVKRGLREQRAEIKKIALYNALFMPAKKVYRVLGATDNPFGEAKKDDMAADADVLLTADPSFATPQARKAEATQLAQTMMQFPAVIGVPELGIPPNMEMQLDLMRDLLHSYQKPDLIARLPAPTKPAMDPKVENQMAVEGAAIDIHPADDDIGHNIEHLAYLASPEGAGIGEDVKRAIVEHTFKHIVAAKFKKDQAAMQQAAAQAAQNGAGAPGNGALPTEDTEDAELGTVGTDLGVGG